jgi:hypothetical protein
LLVHDLAKLAGTVTGEFAKTVFDAGSNIMAPLNQGIMGGVYKDNAVAATSRQRGVMAIASSQLNARSVLGNEGAAMYARFG